MCEDDKSFVIYLYLSFCIKQSLKFSTVLRTREVWNIIQSQQSKRRLSGDLLFQVLDS